LSIHTSIFTSKEIRYRLAESSSLGDRTFSSSSSDSNTINDEALLRFVAETTSFIGSGRTGCSVNDVELTVFPATNAEEKTKDIGLFVFVELCQLAFIL
jgi:hypothetical protein